MTWRRGGNEGTTGLLRQYHVLIICCFSSELVGILFFTPHTFVINTLPYERVLLWKNFIINILRNTEADCVRAMEGTQKRQILSFAVDLVSRVTSEKCKWKYPVILKWLLSVGLYWPWHAPGLHTGSSWLYNPYLSLTLKSTDKTERLLINGSGTRETAASHRVWVILNRCLHFLGSLCYADKLLSLPHLLLRAGARTEWEHANEGAL